MPNCNENRQILCLLSGSVDFPPNCEECKVMMKWKDVSGDKIQFYVKLFEEGTYHLGFAEHSKVKLIM